MSMLTEEEREYLAGKGIPSSNLFDATGLKKSEYRTRMKELGVEFAFGTKPCERGGHRLRSRSGHCIVCNPQSISQYRRNRSKGFVYVAWSAATRQIKVGSTTDLIERGKQLNIYRYGGASDWSMIAKAWTDRAGEVECEVHRTLRRTSVTGSYWKAGMEIACYELFACKIDEAVAAMNAAISATGTRSRRGG